LTIYAYEELFGKTFDVEIVVEDADHATSYEFTVTIPTPPEPETQKEEIKDKKDKKPKSTTEDFVELQGYKPKDETGF